MVKPSPAAMAKVLGSAEALDRRRTAQLEKAHNDGVRQGRREAKIEILDIIQDRFMANDIERDSPEAKALLRMAMEISKHYREHP